MQPNTRRRNGVAAGSVWETRMKMDEVTGGMKVFNAVEDSHDDDEGLRVYGKIRRRRIEVGVEKRKRKNWNQIENQISSPILHSKLSSIESVDGDHDEIEIEVHDDREIKKSFDDKEMDLPAEKAKQIEELKTIEEKIEIPISYNEDLNAKDPDLQDEEEIIIDRNNVEASSNKMQHIVDLVMWKDISRTSFAFGFGTFLILSSSYAGDLNFSLISVISYLGLLYLAAIFLFRSILRRGDQENEINDMDDKCLVGEEDAIRIVRRMLPYMNEVFLRTRALFSGDPETTMKMAVILFVMARCGSSLNISTLAKLAFYGVFTVPKALSSYSVQLSRHGKFWLARFQDGWESCTHKKAIAVAMFTLIWNLSSTIARIWAVFMLVIVMRLYQQSMITSSCEDEVSDEKQQQHQDDPPSPPTPSQQKHITNSSIITPRPQRVPGLAKMPLVVKVKRVK